MEITERYSIYADLIQKQIFLSIGILIVAVLVITLALIFLYTDRRTTLLVIIIMSVVCIGFYIFSIVPYKKDISENAYVEYTGNFYIERYGIQNRVGNLIYVKYDGAGKTEKYHFLCSKGVEFDEQTEYYGTLVYSKHSKCLVELNIYKSYQ